MKDKARYYQLQRHSQPEKVSVKVSELEERAKEHDIFDVAPFLRSKLFQTNGYVLSDKNIDKYFKMN